MLNNYLKLALRNIKRNKVFSLINIIGLSIGMAVSLIMLMYVVDANSFDKYHKDYENIYRICAIWKSNENPMKFAGTMPAISPALNERYSSIKAARILPIYSEIELEYKERTIQESNAFYADHNLFSVFSYEFISGDINSALNEPFTVVLTEQTAKKYFGSENPINKYLIFGDYQLLVTGLIENIPQNSHIQADLFISYKTFESLKGSQRDQWNSWGETFNFIKISDGVRIEDIKKGLDEMIKANAGEWFADNIEVNYQRLADIHWINDYRGDIGPKDDKMNLYIFLTAAIVILMIACFNFMNLSTARFLERMKEIGIRKVIGANRSQLVTQFLIESLLISFISVGIGIIVFKLINSSLYRFFDKQIVVGNYHLLSFILIVTSMIILVGIVAGGYPAFYYSKFKPVDTIKKNHNYKKSIFPFRKILVIAQFTLSIMLIFGTLVIFKQIDFAKNADLGYEKEDVALLYVPSNESMMKKYELLKERLNNYSGIKGVSGAYTVAGVNSRENVNVIVLGNEEKEGSIQSIAVDYDFISVMGVEILYGRTFSNKFTADIQGSVILNETAVRGLSLSDPVGQQLKFPSNGSFKIVTVIGVVKDYHIQSLHSKIPPVLLYINPERFYNVLIKLNPGTENEVVPFIKETWASIFPLEELELTTLADSYKKLYQSEDRTSSLLLLFTLFAIFIAALGLFGLTSFTISKRVKEIGIRKVLGASASTIVIHLIKDILLWVLIAILFALPIAQYLMSTWLQGFEYRTSIPIWIYFISGVFVLFIAIITVSSKSIKAATANPVDSLRNE